jgi:hypothetical protein
MYKDPLKKYLAQTLGTIRKRCNNKNHDKYKYYGGKGIVCFLNKEDLKFLWYRDSGHLLKRPSIDRKDSSKNYTIENCQFVELSYNISKEKIGKKYSDELRKKLSLAHMGHKIPKKTRTKIGIGLKRYWASK